MFKSARQKIAKDEESEDDSEEDDEDEEDSEAEGNPLLRLCHADCFKHTFTEKDISSTCCFHVFFSCLSGDKWNEHECGKS